MAGLLSIDGVQSGVRCGQQRTLPRWFDYRTVPLRARLIKRPLAELLY